MTILSILIALLAERVLPQLVDFRRFDWLRNYSRWMIDVLQTTQPRQSCRSTWIRLPGRLELCGLPAYLAWPRRTLARNDFWRDCI